MPMPATSFGLYQKTSRPVLRISRRRRGKRAPKQHPRKRCYDGGGGRKKTWKAAAEGSRSASTQAVAERLEALRNLIPHPKPAVGVAKEAAAGDRLFDETADYILLLRTQVEVLKRLVDIYSGPCAELTGGAY